MKSYYETLVVKGGIDSLKFVETKKDAALADPRVSERQIILVFKAESILGMYIEFDVMEIKNNRTYHTENQIRIPLEHLDKIVDFINDFKRSRGDY